MSSIYPPCFVCEPSIKLPSESLPDFILCLNIFTKKVEKTLWNVFDFQNRFYLKYFKVSGLYQIF